MNESYLRVSEKFSANKDSSSTFNEDHRVSLVDVKSNRYIGLLDGEVKLLREFGDTEMKPFVLRSILPFLPRVGEYILLPSYRVEILVKKIVHDITISKKYPSWTILFVEYTK